MDIQEIISKGGLIIAAIFTVVQVTPIKINPWSIIGRAIGKLLCAEVLEKIDENEANTSRYRILRFDDEIRHGKKHTEEHFNQIMDDIAKYERYCLDHPKYPNGKAVSAVEKIKKVYEKCKDERSFL